MDAGRYCSVPRAGSDRNGDCECLEHDLHKELWKLIQKERETGKKKAVNGSDTDALGWKLAPSGRDEIKSSVFVS